MLLVNYCNDNGKKHFGQVPFDTAIEFALCAKTFPPNRVTGTATVTQKFLTVADFATTWFKFPSQIKTQTSKIIFTDYHKSARGLVQVTLQLLALEQQVL